MSTRSHRRDWETKGRLLLLAVAGLILGCDRIDPSVLLPRSSETTGSGGSAEADGPAFSPPPTEAARPTGDAPPSPKRRDPSLESIEDSDTSRLYYQFVDDRGRVQFVERLADVPAAWRDRVGYVEMDQPPPLTPVEARRSWTLSADRTAELLLASASGPRGPGGRQGAGVLLYAADWCGPCKRAKAHLDREGVDYDVLDVDIERNARELREKTGRGGIPVLDFDGEILRGYSRPKYDEAVRQIRS